MTRKNRRIRCSKGFTIMELMVVLGLIALIAVFVLPKMSRAFGKAHITEVITALQHISGELEAQCATRGAPPAATSLKAMIAAAPSGYGDPALVGTTCTGIKVVYTSTDGTMPKVCIKRVPPWKYGMVLGTSPDYAAEDLTVPATMIDTTETCQ